MLYGHVETPAQRIDHLLRLRELQDETGGFQAFVPLAFHPENTALGSREGNETRSKGERGKGSRGEGENERCLPASGGALEGEGSSVSLSPFPPFSLSRTRGAAGDKGPAGPSAFLDLRTIAVSRLMLDNFPHVKAYWISLGVGTRRSRCATGRTIWTAQCATSGSTTTPARSRPRPFLWRRFAT